MYEQNLIFRGMSINCVRKRFRIDEFKHKVRLRTAINPVTFHEMQPNQI